MSLDALTSPQNVRNQPAVVDYEESTPKKGFFSIDVRSWRYALTLGINAAVSLLVLARGSGGDNATTAWSADAIERYTRISRGRAKEAIAKLEHHGVLELLRGGTKPLRRIKAAHEFVGYAGYRGELTDAERALLLKLPRTEASLEKSERMKSLADRLVDKGHAEWIIGGYDQELVAKEGNAEPTTQLAWLPNTIVDGAADEVPPLELARQKQCIATLRMLVEAYYLQLGDFGGLDTRLIYKHFQRDQLGEWGEYRIWRFRHDNSVGCHGPIERDVRLPDWAGETQNMLDIFDPPYFHRGFFGLVKLGLAEWVPSLFESSLQESQLVYPSGLRVDAAYLTSDEVRFDEVAQAVAIKMVPHQQGSIDRREIVVPVPAHIDDVQLRGVLRMRYRAHTSLTERWCAETGKLKHVCERFDEILS